ncbi:SDR family NAD(P)-dependent oxidoreductase [Propioniciclava soli]|uniref:SDR family NAD(P)-dependent oxidoreductase n=1 Tax=Propioniciclava soli TaxID=2775081 RepID=A0ABZ3C9E5_9ACTN
MDVRDKVFLVTGGGNGIGRELVWALLAKGARVAAVDLNAEGLAQTASRALSVDRLSTHEVNVTDADAVAALPEAVLAAHGQVDGLVNVAGIIQRFVRFGDLTNADIAKVMNVNFYGVVHMVQAFLPLLVERPAASLVNVSSMGGFVPVPGQTIYGASKAAVKLLTEGLRAELHGSRVKVTVVFPGAVGTNITANSGVSIPGQEPSPEGEATAAKTTSPADAAATILRGIERGSYRVFIGNDARGLDLLTRIAPERAVDLLAQQMAHLLKDR